MSGSELEFEFYFHVALKWEIPRTYFVLIRGNRGHVSQRKVLWGTPELEVEPYGDFARAPMRKMADVHKEKTENDGR
jgi:hypothetical protein